MAGEGPIKAFVPVDLCKNRVKLLALIELMYSLSIVNPPPVTRNNAEEKILAPAIALMGKTYDYRSS